MIYSISKNKPVKHILISMFLVITFSTIVFTCLYFVAKTSVKKKGVEGLYENLAADLSTYKVKLHDIKFDFPKLIFIFTSSFEEMWEGERIPKELFDQIEWNKVGEVYITWDTYTRKVRWIEEKYLYKYKIQEH